MAKKKASKKKSAKKKVSKTKATTQAKVKAEASVEASTKPKKKTSTKTTKKKAVTRKKSSTPQIVVLSHDEIAERAYHIWRNKGCPENQSETHWEEAKAELAKEA